MTFHLLLLGVLLAFIVVLELLNAYFERLFNTQRAALDEDIEAGRARALRIAAAKLIGGLAFVSLYVHELMHALAQLVSGTRPRIVICKNGGYAEAQPWADTGGAKLVAALGVGLLRGVSGMAPLLGGTALIYAVVRFTAPLEAGSLLTLADALATAPSFGSLMSALGSTIASLLGAIVGAPAWAIALIVAVGLVLGWGLTPSSADFHNAAPHLLAYALAYLSAAALLPSPWLLLAIGGLGVALYLVALIKLGAGWIAWMIGGYTMTCGLIGLLALVGALGDAPALGLARGLGAAIVLLSLASCLYVAFLLVLFVLALVNSPSAAFVRRRQGDSPDPGVLASLVRSFDTCTACNLHFRGRCDGCGRTIEEINAG